MDKLKIIVKKIPGARFFYHKMMGMYLQTKTPEQIFTGYYIHNSWNGKESVSGRGSDLDQTKLLIEKLPALLKEFHIQSMLDLPCGDFNWMQNVKLDNIKYFGADIVETLVHENIKKYSCKNKEFFRLNLLQDPLPDVDLIFCRDCLVHFSNQDVFTALNNITSSEAKYLLTTTFPKKNRNSNIVTGQWRPLNLQLSPFYFPTPIKIINEASHESKDKSLGLWSIEQLRFHLLRKNN